MEAVIFIGLQGAGKSSFYKERFFQTHVRINLDMLKTRNREKVLLKACLETGQPFVVDNTNPTRTEREAYLKLAKDAGYRLVGFYFQSRVEECRKRNFQRAEGEQIPLKGILGTAARMELPKLSEGFNQLFYVRIDDTGRFVIEDWKDEV